MIEGYFIWLWGPRGPVPQKWPPETLAIEISKRGTPPGEKRPTILAQHPLHDRQWDLPIKTLVLTYPAPAFAMEETHNMEDDDGHKRKPRQV